MVDKMPDSLLTTKQAAELLNMSVAFLERDRWQGALIPFVVIGTRSIRYKLGDLLKYIEGNTKRSTSEY